MVRSNSGAPLTLLLVYVVAITATANSLAFCADGPVDPRDAKINSELAKPTAIDFKDVPLKVGIDYLIDFHHIDIRLDKAALERANISSNIDVTYVSAATFNITLSKALAEMLNPKNLSFMIKDHWLTITTLDEAKDWQEQFAEKANNR